MSKKGWASARVRRGAPCPSDSSGQVTESESGGTGRERGSAVVA